MDVSQKMEHYRKKMEDIQRSMIEYLEDESNDNEYFKKLITLVKIEKICNDKSDFISFLYLISKISKNCCRSSEFFNKIEHILLHYLVDIQTTFSNHEIFHIFQKNRRILLFLIEQKLVIIDEYIFNIWDLKRKENPIFNYFIDFYSEIKCFLNKEQIIEYERMYRLNDEDFQEKRRIGENHQHIAFLIRNDYVEDFISYVSKTNFQLSSKLEYSIYESNKFLQKHHPTLIEYSVFYGSIQIFNFLLFSNVKLTSSLWLFAVHGNNADIIHILESNNVIPANNSYLDVIIESIKCHNENLTRYLIDNYANCNSNEICFLKCLQEYNFASIPENADYKSVFYYFCKYDHAKIVDFLLKTNEIDVNLQNEKEILNNVKIKITEKIVDKGKMCRPKLCD